MEKGKRLIDANPLVSYLWTLYKFFGTIPCSEADKATQRGIRRCIGEIKKMPTVDAVEVVRCKDCKHSKLPAVLTQKYGEPGTLTCHNWHSPCNKRNVNQDDFCSYGERRDEE